MDQLITGGSPYACDFNSNGDMVTYDFTEHRLAGDIQVLLMNREHALYRWNLMYWHDQITVEQYHEKFLQAEKDFEDGVRKALEPGSFAHLVETKQSE